MSSQSERAKTTLFTGSKPGLINSEKNLGILPLLILELIDLNELKDDANIPKIENMCLCVRLCLLPKSIVSRESGPWERAEERPFDRGMR